MGYRTIKSAEKVFVLKNTSGYALTVSGASVAPGKSREVAAWVYMQDKFRSGEVATLISKGHLSVTLGGMPVTADYMRGLEAPVGVPDARVPSMTTAELALLTPAVGTMAFDTTLAALVTWDGSAWV